MKASIEDYKSIIDLFYPDLYNEYMTSAQESENISGVNTWSGNPKYNTEYRRKRVEEMELKELERW